MQNPGSLAALIGIAVLLSLGAVLALVANDISLGPREISDRLRTFGPWAPLAIIILMIVHSVVPFPAEVLAICAGMIFGVLIGTLLIWIGAMMGALVSFWISRRFGRSVVLRYLPARQASALDKWSREQGTVTLLISRFIPVIAFNLINYAAGLTRVPLWTFVWTTGLGILPITVLSTYLGTQMRELTWPILLVSSAIGIGIIWAGHTVARKRNWI